MKTKKIGFAVAESNEDFEQLLGLEFGDGLPAAGVLCWIDRTKGAAVVFASRAQARDAINRTEHYRLAFGAQSPEKQWMRIVPLEQVAESESDD